MPAQSGNYKSLFINHGRWLIYQCWILLNNNRKTRLELQQCQTSSSPSLDTWVQMTTTKKHSNSQLFTENSNNKSGDHCYRSDYFLLPLIYRSLRYISMQIRPFMRICTLVRCADICIIIYEQQAKLITIGIFHLLN